MTTSDHADARYQFAYPVRDPFGRERMLRIGAENGEVIWDGPPWGTVDPDEADRIDLGWKASANRARLQRQSRQ